MPDVSQVMGRTSRIVVRRMEISDLDACQRVLEANQDWLRPWSPHPLASTRTDKVREGIMTGISEWVTDSSYRAGIWMGSEFVGRISLSVITRGNFQNAHSGYWISRLHAGKGIVAEAAVLSLRFAFRELGLHRVQYAIMPENRRSVRIMEKLGICQEGFARRYLQIAGDWADHRLFAITAEEFAEREGELSAFLTPDPE